MPKVRQPSADADWILPVVTCSNLFSAGSSQLGLGFATPKHGYATHNLVAVPSYLEYHSRIQQESWLPL